MSRHKPSSKPLRKGTLVISSIRVNAGTQSRAAISEATVAEYAEAMIRGDRFPALIVFQGEDGLILADGFHRVRSAKQAGFDTITAQIRRGNRLDALRYSLSANHTHGLRRTNEDKRHAVTLALRELSHLSDRMVAGICGVSVTFVGNARRELSIVDNSAKRLGKDGKSRSLPSKRTVSPVPSMVDAAPDRLSDKPLNGVEREAHEAALGVAQQLCALDTSLRSALSRFPTKKAMLLALVRKVRRDLLLLEREIAAPR
jgi:hypothetical protein